MLTWHLIDAFTDRPLRGNPAAVVVLPAGDWPAERWLQAVATEMNQSETAYLLPGDAPGRWGLRWFTPAAEVELCGHATLASAHLLWERGDVAADQPIVFGTRYRGELTCRRGGAGEITMRFPADAAERAEAPGGLLEHLRLTAGDVVGVARSRYDWLVELPDVGAVRSLSPDFAGLAAVETRGVIVSARTKNEERRTREDEERDMSRSAPPSAFVLQPSPFHVVSRFFAPRLRIAEDPVTGSAHCVIGPYWFDRLGRDTLHCHQASPRGGELTVTRDGDEHVLLAGHAVTVSRGELLTGPGTPAT
jgi:PhzF family phenazine biosynthesis protein